MEPTDARTILMTNTEAVHSLYGEISTERDGDLTHQCIQTNLADVICGGMSLIFEQLYLLLEKIVKFFFITILIFHVLDCHTYKRKSQ